MRVWFECGFTSHNIGWLVFVQLLRTYTQWSKLRQAIPEQVKAVCHTRQAPLGALMGAGDDSQAALSTPSSQLLMQALESKAEGPSEAADQDPEESAEEEDPALSQFVRDHGQSVRKVLSALPVAPQRLHPFCPSGFPRICVEVG